MGLEQVQLSINLEDRKTGRPIRYGCESVYQEHVALLRMGAFFIHETKPGSEPKAHARTCSWKRLQKTRRRRVYEKHVKCMATPPRVPEAGQNSSSLRVQGMLRDAPAHSVWHDAHNGGWPNIY
ncbi:hypothetical protein EVAR_2564_1 [Eumeta japonica]|uniref:Uncharacterized protein n=1 Tax=Eumeta variegata TaxID=151549 RepID=A0A4C1SPB7_EUMVA|nr:hypothetical protein EVAR_2564_1 [Eumeta japonica]